MKMIEVKRDSTDALFREATKELIDSAEKEIIVIAGELSAYDFHDLKLATESARDRAVKIRIYASRPDQDTVNRLVYNGCEVYIGAEKPKDHYMIVDGISYMISEKEKVSTTRTRVGSRYAKKYIDYAKGAQELVAYFERLTKKAKKAEIKGKDPLIKALDSPIDWGVETDSSKIHDYFR